MNFTRPDSIKHRSFIGRSPWLIYSLIAFFALIPYDTFAEHSVKIVESSISSHLHQGAITALLKDARGSLWIGTQHGLYSFDGAELSHYSSSSKANRWIPASDVRGLALNQYNQVLIATFGGGLLYLDEKDYSFSYLEHKIDPSFIYPIGLIGSEKGSALAYTESSYQPLEYGPDSYISYDSATYADGNDSIINSVALYHSDQFFISRGKQLVKATFTEDASQKEETVFTSSFGEITALKVVDEKVLYLGTDMGNVIALEIPTYELKFSSDLDSSNTISVTSLNLFDDSIWVGTTNGLYQLDKELASLNAFRRDNSGLTDNHVLTMINDHNFMWIGTYKGLNTLSTVQFQSFNNKNSGVFDDVMALEIDDSNHLWVGTFNGLFLFDEEKNIHRRFDELFPSLTLADSRIMTIAADKELVWLGFRKNGYQIFNIETHELNSLNAKQSRKWEVTKIVHDKNSRSWIATYNEGLFSIEKGILTSYLQDGTLNEKSIIHIYESSLGIIVGSERDLYIYDKSTSAFRRLPFEFKNIEPAPLIYSISQSPLGDLWIGTKDYGTFIWHKSEQKASRYQLTPTKHSLSRMVSTIYGIQFDGSGNAWCSTQIGLLRIDERGSFKAHYTAANGLQGNDFNFGASLAGPGNILYFGGSSGYTKFSPIDIGETFISPEIRLLNVIVHRNTVSLRHRSYGLTKVNFDHLDDVIEFQFAVMDFLDPERNQYRYKLEGFDHQWIEAGTRNTATYTSLPPGDYVLRVQGANSAGVWNTEGISLQVHVAPPPWQTWWAYCIYTLTAFCMFWIGKRAYDSYAIERRAIVRAAEMNIEAERADEELQEQLEIQDELVQSVYRHNVATLELVAEVISIRNRAGSPDPRAADDRPEIDRVQALVALEECVYHHNESLLADLKKYTDIIIPRLLMESARPAETITTINDVSSTPIPLSHASPLAIAIYELLENAVRHAFQDEAPTHYLHVSLTAETMSQGINQRHLLSVADDGVGLPPDLDPLTPTCPGFAVVKAMSERLGGTLHIERREGTRVTITFEHNA